MAESTTHEVKTLKKFINDEKGHRVGLIVAGKSLVDRDIVRVGWSLIHENHIDTYDNRQAHVIAYGRIDKQSKKPIPQRIKEDVLEMANRAAKYFKQEIIVSGVIVDDLDTYRREQWKVASSTNK